MEVVYKYGYWWISDNGEILTELGKFIDPVSPKIISEALRDEEKNNDLC